MNNEVRFFVLALLAATFVLGIIFGASLEYRHTQSAQLEKPQ